MTKFATFRLGIDSENEFTVGLSGPAMTGGQSVVPAGGLNQQFRLDAWGNLSSMGSSGFSQPVSLQN
jgi:hypothetical protein